VAKQKLKVSAALPAIAKELLDLKNQLISLKLKCKNITGK